MRKEQCHEVQKTDRRRATISLMIVSAVLLSMLFARFARHHSPSQMFVFVIYCAIAVADAWAIGRLFVKTHDYRHLALTLLGSFIAALAMEGLTVLGSPAGHFRVLADWSIKRILFFAFVIVTAFLVTKLHCPQEEGGVGGSVRKRTTDKPVCIGAVVAICLIVSFGIGAATPIVFMTCALLAAVALLTLCFAGRLSLPVTFFFASLLMGSLLIYGLPVTTGLSWDDQIHYKNALDASFLFESQLTDTDIHFCEEAPLRAEGKDAPEINRVDYSAVEEHKRALDASYSGDVLAGRVRVDKTEESVFNLTAVGYVPSAIGLWLGRLLHMGFSQSVCFAKMLNLISYCGVVAFAIAVTPSKKGLFAFVGLLPTCIFLASNFSYDAWLNSFVMLGFAFYLRYAWGDREDFTVKNVVLAFVFTFLGLAVKVAYFPLIGLFFAVPKERFSGRSQRRAYNCAVFLLGLLTFASFALPYLFRVQGDAGDARGGSNINPMEQIIFILEDPLRYAKILFNFFAYKYLAPANSIEYAMNYAYLGSLGKLLMQTRLFPVAGCTLSALLVLNAVFSCDDHSLEHVSVWQTMWALFVFIFICFLVASALYVTFTPVGLDTVNGCQYRYLLPTLVPCLSMSLNVNGPTLGLRNGFNAAWLMIGFVLCLTCTYLFVYPLFF